jgi:hexosaminidase
MNKSVQTIAGTLSLRLFLLCGIKVYDMLKRFKKIFCFILIVLASHQLWAQVSIIPKPAEITILPGVDSFAVTPKTVIVIGDKSLQPSVDFFNEYLKQVLGFQLKTAKKLPVGNAIALSVHKDGRVSGAYKMDINKRSVVVNGEDESGVFYAMQTLLQLLPVDKAEQLRIPLLQIKDAPRFQYRGMHLDVGRHFFPVSFIKQYIDYLALHKMNYFHWHLTEDQGWRIEIKKYPRLTQVGAYRNGTIIGHYPGTGNDGKRYGGFYTQKEIKEIVTYAARRYITVVPEIEMPGHSAAALTAYPSLGCTGGPYEVRQTWGVSKDVFCAGNDSVFTFLQDVLDEVMALFPSRYIHVGGDECPKDRWKECPKCQRRIKDNHLKDEHELQSYFIQRIEKYINSKGRILIGWDEILEGGLAPNAVVMSWRGEQGGIEAARQKHDVIMTPSAYLYFNQYQGKASTEPLAIGGYLTLQKVYSYNPVPEQLSAEEAKYIRGVQANLWTEYIATQENATYMALPRMAALAEIAWTSPEQKNWDDFSRRMQQQYQRYDALNIVYAKTVYDVQQTILLESALSRATVSLADDAYGTKIYYTLDGSEPSNSSSLYSKPFIVRKSVIVKAASFKDGKKVGQTTVQQVIIN